MAKRAVTEAHETVYADPQKSSRILHYYLLFFNGTSNEARLIRKPQLVEPTLDLDRSFQ